MGKNYNFNSLNKEGGDGLAVGVVEANNITRGERGKGLRST